jgi:hypothetical protein
MDSKGIYSIDFLFSIFLSLIIAISVFGFIGGSLENEKTAEEDITGRILVDKIANTINQVNSNNIGNLQEFKIPNNISGKSFLIIVQKNEVVLFVGTKKAESTIFPIRLSSNGENSVEEIRLYPSESYIVKKIIDTNNLTKIQIYRF